MKKVLNTPITNKKRRVRDVSEEGMDVGRATNIGIGSYRYWEQ